MSVMQPLPKNWKTPLPPLPKNWKKELPPLPKKEKSSKKEVIFAKEVPDLPAKPKKVKKPPKALKRTPLKRPTKPISQIGKRTKERIKANGTESALFVELWKSHDDHGHHWCEICGGVITDAVVDDKVKRPECFSHNLSKGRYPEYRYDPRNITLVCSTECHAENDRINAHHDAELIARLS